MRKLCPNCRRDVDLKNDRMTNAKICSICGTVVVHASTQLQAGSIVGGFQIETELGRGGMGIVYRAKQLNLERQVALKVLADDLAEDDAFVDSFFREARAAAGLSHPNIVQVYDAGSTPEGIYYFAMELVVGETLDTRIVRDGALNPRDALDIAAKIAGALNYAWQTQQLCHGDIKPDNIILNSSGGAKLADLGLAKFMHEEKSGGDSGHELMGTPLYAPPEVINGQVDRIDCRSDMYSFGATLFHMLSGIPPFPGANPEEVLSRHLHDPPPSLMEFNHELNPQIDELVQALLAKKIEDRPTTWADVERMMHRIHDVERKIFHRASPSPFHRATGGAVAESPPAEERDPASTLIKMLVVVAMILGAAVLGFHLMRNRSNPVPPPLAGPEVSPVPSVDPILVEWETLQRQLPANRNDACVILEAFLAKHGEAAPPSARQLLDKYRSELNQLSQEREERDRQKAQFEKRVAAVRQRLAVTPLTLATPAEPLHELSTEIEEVLDLANRNAHLKLTQEETDSLNQIYMNLSTVLMEWDKIKAERLQEEQERLAQERRAQEQLAREEQGRKHQELLAGNACTDEYYLLIADYLAKRNLATFVKDFTLWHEKHQTIPGEILGRRDFLLEKVVPAETGFLSLFQRHLAAFAGQILPDELATPQYRRYKVDSFTDSGMRLFLEDEKVRLGGSLPWSRIPADQLILWVNARLAESGETLTEEDRRAILAHLLLNNLGPALRQALQGYPDVPKNERALWTNVALDFEQAAREQGLIVRWQAIQAALTGSDNDTAAALFGEFRIQATGSFFADRYRPEIDRLSELLGYFNPVIPLQAVLDEADAALRDKKTAEALALVMSANSRYAATPGLSDELRARLAQSTQQALAAVQGASQVKDVNASRLPFYYWEKEISGDAWVYARIIRESKLLDKSPPLLANLESAALLDAGDWAGAAATARKGMPPGKLAVMKGRMQAWAPALIYARAALAYRYENSAEQGKWLGALTTSTSATALPKMPMKALGTMLQLEYTLCFAPPRVCGIAEKYVFSEDQPELEIRIALLHLLASLQLADIDPKEYGKVCQLYLTRFQPVDAVRQDLAAVRASMSIVEGKWDPAQLEALKINQSAAPDLCARIILEATAYAMTQELTVPGDTALATAAAGAVSGNIASGDLWQRHASYLLATSGSKENMRQTLQRLLQDHRLCALAVYPRLRAIEIALRIADGTYDRPTGKAILARLLEAAPVAADVERTWADVITSESPQDIVTSLSTKGRPDAAFWAAVLGMILHPDNQELKLLLRKRALENDAMLSWEERLLLNNLCRIR